MEIIETIEHTGGVWFHLLLFGSFSIIIIFFAFLLPFLIKASGKSIDKDDIVALLMMLVVGVIFGGVALLAFRIEVPVTYKAKISDFNEVYNNGYEIVDQDGEVYTLEKKD